MSGLVFSILIHHDPINDQNVTTTIVLFILLLTHDDVGPTKKTTAADETKKTQQRPEPNRRNDHSEKDQVAIFVVLRDGRNDRVRVSNFRFLFVGAVGPDQAQPVVDDTD